MVPGLGSEALACWLPGRFGPIPHNRVLTFSAPRCQSYLHECDHLRASSAIDQWHARAQHGLQPEEGIMLRTRTWKQIACGAGLACLAGAMAVAQQQAPARGNHDWAP